MKSEVTISKGTNAFPGFPLVLVSTRDNIITVGLIHKFSFNPFILGIGISYSRYSHKLIDAEKEFAVNIPTADQLKQVEICGKLSGRNVDKFHETGFTKEPGKLIKSALIKESPVSMECKVVDQLKLKEREWFIGEVLAVYAEDDLDVSKFLLCDRTSYLLIGERIGHR